MLKSDGDFLIEVKQEIARVVEILGPGTGPAATETNAAHPHLHSAERHRRRSRRTGEG
jgi:hypothetical protein